MSAMEIDSLWKSAFDEGTVRPVLYTSEVLNDEGWQPLTEPQEFIRNLTTLNHQQLYATSSNNQIAMKLTQDEYLDIERQIAAIKGKATIKNPQSLPEPDVFEERKESSLYGYKYNADRPALLQAGHPGLKSADDLTEREKHDVRYFQEPFEQGGFVPKDREYKLMVAKAKDPKNVDGWEPVIKGGRRFIPKQQTHVDEYNITYVKRNIDANGEIIRPVSPDGSDITGGTPDKAINKRLTRFNGKKVPPTRDVSEVPSGASTPRGRKRGSPSGEEHRDDTPNSKRQKVNTTVDGQEIPKPKHPNQWTKRKAEQERLAREQGSAVPTSIVRQTIPKAASSSARPWREMSPESKRSHAWTNAELHEAIREDQFWLHENPTIAAEWAKKLLANDNPIRSYAMYKKWQEWRDKGADKRPRNKNTMNGDGVTNKENEEYTPAQKVSRKGRPMKPKDSETSTPAITPAATPSPPKPAPEVPEINGSPEQASTPAENSKGGRSLRNKGSGSGTLRQKAMQEEKEKRNVNDVSSAKQESTELRSSSKKGKKEPEPSSSPNTIEVTGNVSGLKRPSLRKQESESTIVVNNSAARSTLPGISPRRSVRNLRRPSA
ncbi:hypothetical protein H2200_002927 [Cladophialophora chaetospira]|uniref:Uncharacterized protein n=1 Tax=Cladophialophora chaetospira TaxID=386627 RepID=A0AA38XGL3_9EURO|nr:hypothetical protein H2200_002927 [Cladophialophora chaetospira]